MGKVNGQSVTSTRKAIVDSGTSLLAVPTADIEKIAQLVGAKKVLPIPPFYKEYTVDCNSPGPDLDIVIGGNTYKPCFIYGAKTSGEPESAIPDWADAEH